MAHTTHVDSNAGKREIKRVTIILTILTLVELAIGFGMYLWVKEDGFLKSFLKGAIIIFMLAKAFYITAYFMHLGHELKNMIMTIVVPLGLFIWFIIAFLYDGASYRDLKNTYDPYHKEASQEKTNAAPAKGHHDVKDKGAQKPAGQE